MLFLNEVVDLKQVERRIYLSYHQDGLIDIFVGAALLCVSLMIWLLPEFWFFLIAGLVAFTTSFAGLKRVITIPRIGYVEFSPTRQRKTQYLFLAFTVILVVFNILGIIAIFYPPLGILLFESLFTILIVGVIGGLIFAAIGYSSHIRRFYSYGIILISSALFTFLFPVLVVLPGLVLGFIMIFYGALLLYWFVKRYPKELHGEMEVD